MRPNIKIPNKEKYPLHYAVAMGDIDEFNVVAQDLEIDINERDDNGWTPLRWAVERHLLDVVELLLQHPKIDVNQPDASGQTPLCSASEKGFIGVVELLLQHPKIDVNLANNTWKVAGSPLYYAVSKNHVEVVKRLLEHPNIDPNKGNYRGQPPLAFAIVHNLREVIKVFKDEEKINELYPAFVKKAIFWIAEPENLADKKIEQHEDYDVKTASFRVVEGRGAEYVEYVIAHPEELPFLINSTSEQGYSLWDLYSCNHMMQVDLFEHGAIPITPLKTSGKITEDNIQKYANDLAEEIIAAFKDKPKEFEEATEELALSLVEIDKPENITYKQQQLLTFINKNFPKIIKYLPDYPRDIYVPPTHEEYKIIIEGIRKSPAMHNIRRTTLTSWQAMRQALPSVTAAEENETGPSSSKKRKLR